MDRVIKNCLAAMATMAALAGCQGQNPFKRDSNPVRNYPKVAQSTKGEGAIPYGSTPPPENRTRFCNAPFVVTSNSPDGKTVFPFAEDSFASYEINVTNQYGESFEAQAEGIPEGVEFKVLKTHSPSSITYSISWTPKNAEGADPQTAKLVLKSEGTNKLCNTTGPATESLTLVVEKSQGRPVVNVSGVPQTSIKFGAEFKFQIDVTDPTATSEKRPALNAFAFEASSSNQTNKVISGAGAVANCDANPKALQNGKWRFTCSFLSGALQKNNEDQLVNSGKTAEASFVASARSRASGKSSAGVKSSVRVVFERVSAHSAAAPQGSKP